MNWLGENRRKVSTAPCAERGKDALDLKLFFEVDQRIAVNSQGLGGLGLIAVVLLQHLLDETLLKLTDGIGVEDFVVDHASNECFKLIFHGSAPR